jgi:hypothetical protein
VESVFPTELSSVQQDRGNASIRQRKDITQRHRKQRRRARASLITLASPDPAITRGRGLSATFANSGLQTSLSMKKKKSEASASFSSQCKVSWCNSPLFDTTMEINACSRHDAGLVPPPSFDQHKEDLWRRTAKSNMRRLRSRKVSPMEKLED